MVRTSPLWRTLLLALLLFGASAVAVGQDAYEPARTTQADSLQPPTWTVPEPHAGDSVVYQAVDDEREWRASWSLGGIRTLPDEWGRDRDYVAFAWSGLPGGFDGSPGAWKNATRTHLFDVESGTVSAWVAEGPSNSGRDGCSMNQCDDATDESHKRSIVYKRDADWTPCGVRHALQGSVPAPGPIALWSNCTIDGIETAEYLLTGVSADGGTVRYEAAENRTAIQEAWFTSESAYPVFFEAYGISFTLVESATGATALPEPEARRPAVLSSADREIWGPKSPTDHDFSLESAWSQAKAETEIAALTDPFIVEASHDRDLGDDQIDAWEFIVRDDRTAYEVEVVRTFGRPDSLLPPLGMETAQESFAVSFDGRGLKELPGRDRLPATMPTADALLALHGDDGISYGFDLYYDAYVTGRDYRQSASTGWGCIGTNGENFCAFPSDGRPYGRNATWTWVDSDGKAWSRTQDTRLIHPMDPGPATAERAPPAEPLSGESTSTTIAPSWDIDVATAAGLGGLALLLVLLHHFAPAIFGFTRKTPDTAVDHPTRERIMAIVEMEPGIHRAQLVERLGIPRSTVRAHLSILERVDLLQSRRVGRYQCLFAGDVARDDLATARVLRARTARSILAAVESTPGIDGRSLAATVGAAPSTVHYHVQRLADAGLITVEGDGGKRRYAIKA